MTDRLRLSEAIAACLFDLDGVLTRTAVLHAAAWKETFDGFLRARPDRRASPTVPFDLVADYQTYVDGKPREDGVRSFLASRGIELPKGSRSDSASAQTVHGLGLRKNELVSELIRQRGVQAYEGSVRFVKAAQRAGLSRAVVSSSENAPAVLRAAGLDTLFDVTIDGVLATSLGLHGKPEPDLFLEAARRLGASPRQAAVFEDAVAGVAAGHVGGFVLVVGVDRADHATELRAHGADLVVRDLAELLTSS